MQHLPDEIKFTIGTFLSYNDVSDWLSSSPMGRNYQAALIDLLRERDIIQVFEDYRIYRDKAEYQRLDPNYQEDHAEPFIAFNRGFVLENEFTENRLEVKEIKDSHRFELHNDSLLIPIKHDGITNLMITSDQRCGVHFKVELMIGGQVIDTYRNVIIRDAPFDIFTIPFLRYHDVILRVQSDAPVQFSFDYVEYKEFSLGVRYEWWITQKWYDFSPYLRVSEIECSDIIVANSIKVKGGLKLPYAVRIHTLQSDKAFVIHHLQKIVFFHGMCGLRYSL